MSIYQSGVASKLLSKDDPASVESASPSFAKKAAPITKTELNAFSRLQKEHDLYLKTHPTATHDKRGFEIIREMPNDSDVMSDL